MRKTPHETVTDCARWLFTAAAALLLGGCVSAPTGPSMLVLPGSGKNFDQFRADDFECRQYAQNQIGGTTAEQASIDSGVKSAAIATAVGAVAGGIIGGSQGAANGAGVGLLFGSVAGAGAAQGTALTVQQRYDIGYQQCMYAKGHQVPVSAHFDNSRRASGTYAAPPQQPYLAPPPPPPGSPPPPPPGVR